MEHSRIGDPPAGTPVAATATAEAARQTSPTGAPAAVAAPRTLSVADALASVGSRNNLVTNVVVGTDNRIAQIRVVDSVTHEVIAESPPDSIARMQDEMLAYQQVARTTQPG